MDLREKVLGILGDLTSVGWEDDEDMVCHNKKLMGGTISRRGGPQFDRWWPEIKKTIADAILALFAEEREAQSSPKADKWSEWHARWIMSGAVDEVPDADCDNIIADLRRSEAREAKLVEGLDAINAYIQNYQNFASDESAIQFIDAALASVKEEP